MFYIILVGFQAARETLKQLDQGRQAELLVELADIDNLTGLYNRNTYDKWVKEHPRPDGTTMLTFDLNYLKKCNDTLGHAMGDLYIRSAAQIISRVFEGRGKCYRIGGDEYCVITEGLIGSVEMEEKFAEMEKLERSTRPRRLGYRCRLPTDMLILTSIRMRISKSAESGRIRRCMRTSSYGKKRGNRLLCLLPVSYLLIADLGIFFR